MLKFLQKVNARSPLGYPGFISLAIKNAIVYFLLTVAGLAALSYLLFQNSALKIIESSEQQVQQAAGIVDVKFTSFIKNVRRDIIFLAQSPFLNDFLLDGTPRKKQLLSSEYLALLKSKPDYAQIRLIGIENDGKELIRVERLLGQSILVEDGNLQQKGSRGYFQETIRLPADSFFLSSIDLNKEYGKISLPMMPTLRVASPVFRGKSIFGIVIINVNLEALFSELDHLVGENFNLKILNQNGYFLTHPRKENTFGFEFGKPAAFNADFGTGFNQVRPEVGRDSVFLFKENGLLYAFQPLLYPKADYQLFAAVGSSKDAILAGFYTWRQNVLISTFGLAVLILLVILVYMQRQANELKRITETMTRFPGDIDRSELPTSRNDEIGQLARSFKDMSIAIDNNISALKQAKQEVEQAVREKDTFLENMSHEIRNPIHSMIGMTHLLEKNNPGRHQKAFIEALKFNSNNLLSLVNDILDFKKLSSGNLKVNSEWLDLPAFLHKISNSHQFSAVTKKISLTVETDSGLDRLLISTDPVRLTQIVNNLVINALKFTPAKGSVRIQSRLLKKDDGKAKIRVAVRDTGIGIEKDKVDRIVERYYSRQTHDSGIIPPGTGLGLPIVIQLLKLLNTQLIIDSSPGKGSDFYFDLEVPVKINPAGSKVESQSLPVKVLEKLRVLVIDDDDLILLLYENLFTERAAAFTKITNADDLATLDDQAFDLLLTDLHVGQKTPFDFQAQLERVIKKDGLLFVISGVESDEPRISKLPHFEAQFRKPVNPGQLLEAMTLAFASRQFGTPDVTPFWEDYDHEEPKFRRAINLLIEEWKKILASLETVIDRQDVAGYTAIRHKLITSVRRLKLSAFETLLEEPLQGDENALSSSFKEQIRQRMTFYLWWLKWKV